MFTICARSISHSEGGYVPTSPYFLYSIGLKLIGQPCARFEAHSRLSLTLDFSFLRIGTIRFELMVSRLSAECIKPGYAMFLRPWISPGITTFCESSLCVMLLVVWEFGSQWSVWESNSVLQFFKQTLNHQTSSPTKIDVQHTADFYGLRY